GDYLYIDGGVVQKRDTKSTYMRTQNATYSIPLATSWDAQDVKFTMIEKGDDVPIYNLANQFLQSDNASFYTINGDLAGENTFDLPKAPPELWSFEADGKGRGSWHLFSVAPTSIMGSVLVSTATVDSSVYLLGGFQWWRSTLTMAKLNDSSARSANGLVSYDMDTRVWDNQSISYPYPNGWAWGQGFVHLTGLGNQGLLLAMGGSTSRPGVSKGPESFIPYDIISIYNTATNEWRNQTTTGTDIPLGRGIPCTLGVQGDNGTFEVWASIWLARHSPLGSSTFLMYADRMSQIFLYGGFRGAGSNSQSQENTELGQSVYVLSLPSFTWHKFDYPQQTARALFTCSLRNRQVLAIGGLSPDIDLDHEDKDPWPQGIGILDLNDMKWKDSYDSKAGPYETPKQIKDSIAANGQYPQRWDDDLSRQWIMGDRSATTGNDTNLAPSPAPTLTSSSSGSSHTGAIVGGVVGGVAALILVAAVSWYLLRRSRRGSAPSQAAQNQHHGFEKPELENSDRNPEQELSGDPKDHLWSNGELQGIPLLELDGGRTEMEASTAKYELHSTGR
ncbi:MAG: hypothetical protein Q9222_007803, partial [Ikaeria aurantiellina]